MNHQPSTKRSAFTLIEMLACQPKPWRRQGQSAFTLIEMLVVIAILGILMAMMVPAAGLILRRAAKARAQADAGVVATVLLKYQAEYNRWPTNYVPDMVDTTDADWVKMMAPQPGSGPVPTNPKRIVFFEPGGGALGTNAPHAGAFVDAWGTPFKYRVDQDGDEQLANPNEDTGGILRARVLAWSAGPDGDYATWDDNAASWE